MAQDVAYNCENRLRGICKVLEDTGQTCLDRAASKINVLVLQRRDDMSTPLVRDFHYLPLLHDHLFDPARGGLVFKGQSVALEGDEVLEAYQYCHFGEVLESLQRDVKKFSATSATVKAQKGDNSTGNMDKALRELPSYSSKVKQYEQHIAMVQSIMSGIQEKKLLEVGEIEQTLSTQVDSQGKPAEASSVLKSVLACLSNNISLSAQDRMRVITLTFLNLALTSGDR